MKKRTYINFARYANFAFSFGTTSIASMLLGFFGGRWLDGKLGTSPLFMLAGILLGVAVTFKALMTELSILERSEEFLRKKEEEDEKEK